MPTHFKTEMGLIVVLGALGVAASDPRLEGAALLAIVAIVATTLSKLPRLIRAAVTVALIVAAGCSSRDQASRDGTNHAVMLRACVEHRPLADCHRDACRLYQRARACKAK